MKLNYSAILFLILVLASCQSSDSKSKVDSTSKAITKEVVTLEEVSQKELIGKWKIEEMIVKGTPNSKANRLFLEFKDDTFYLDKIIPSTISAESSMENGNRIFSNPQISKLSGTRRIGNWSIIGDSILLDIKKFHPYNEPNLMIDSIDFKKFLIRKSGEKYLMTDEKRSIKFYKLTKDYWDKFVNIDSKSKKK